MASIADRGLVMIDPKRPRNPQHHRKLFVLLQLVHENLPESKAGLYPTVENLLDAIKVTLGHVETIVLPASGAMALKPKSISFASMPQDEFAVFYDATLALIAKHFLPNVASKDLEREIEEFLK